MTGDIMILMPTDKAGCFGCLVMMLEGSSWSVGCKPSSHEDQPGHWPSTVLFVATALQRLRCYDRCLPCEVRLACVLLFGWVGGY
jgi:hypothetical protein